VVLSSTLASVVEEEFEVLAAELLDEELGPLDGGPPEEPPDDEPLD
jgi:hypothetical protein